MKFDLTITMEQRGGRCKYGDLDARIICSNLRGNHPIVVAVNGNDGQEFVITCAFDGSTLDDRPDITTLSETKVFYSYVHSDGTTDATYGSMDQCLQFSDYLGSYGLGGIIKITMTGDLLTSIEQVEL